jgi:hypothetical protein
LLLIQFSFFVRCKQLVKLMVCHDFFVKGLGELLLLC